MWEGGIDCPSMVSLHWVKHWGNRRRCEGSFLSFFAGVRCLRLGDLWTLWVVWGGLWEGWRGDTGGGGGR